MSHLVQVIYKGYPIKLLDLNISDEMRETVIDVLRAKAGETSLKLIKEACPTEVTYDQLKIVIAYMKIRDHLHSNNIPYEDFEEHDFVPSVTSCSTSEAKLNLLTSLMIKSTSSQGISY